MNFSTKLRLWRTVNQNGLLQAVGGSAGERAGEKEEQVIDLAGHDFVSIHGTLGQRQDGGIILGAVPRLILR